MGLFGAGFPGQFALCLLVERTQTIVSLHDTCLCQLLFKCSVQLRAFACETVFVEANDLLFKRFLHGLAAAWEDFFSTISSSFFSNLTSTEIATFAAPMTSPPE